MSNDNWKGLVLLSYYMQSNSLFISPMVVKVYGYVSLYGDRPGYLIESDDESNTTKPNKNHTLVHTSSSTKTKERS